MMRVWLGCAALLLTVTCVAGARADDVTDQIDEALKAYRSHDPQTAIAALDAAANLLRQSRADGLKRLLPAAPPGWTADEAEGIAVGAALLGGGTTASRAYHNGRQRVDVQIIADSPMLQGLAGLLGSPFVAIGGIKTVVIGGRRMSYVADDNSYTTMVADRIIVKVGGSKDTPDPTLKSFIGVIDFAAIEKVAH